MTAFDAAPVTFVKKSVLIACAAILSSCASTSPKNSDIAYRDSIKSYSSPSADPNGMDPVAAAAYWGTRYNRDHNDPVVAAEYAGALRKIGSVDQAVSVAVKAAAQFPDHSQLQLETGKALIESERAFEAIRYAESAAENNPNDWNALSTYGVALDHIGEYEAARLKYDEALAIAPGTAQILNNKGLSYALSGDLRDAERTLRHAVSRPGADARMRQNLALVLAIKGDMREAVRLARSDLPPRVAEQNIDYFRSLLGQPAYWADYTPDNFEEPVFAPLKPEESADNAPLTPLEPKPAKKSPASQKATPLVEQKTVTPAQTIAADGAPVKLD